MHDNKVIGNWQNSIYIGKKSENSPFNSIPYCCFGGYRFTNNNPESAKLASGKYF